jgi:hypothetical protein
LVSLAWGLIGWTVSTCGGGSGGGERGLVPTEVTSCAATHPTRDGSLMLSAAGVGSVILGVLAPPTKPKPQAAGRGWGVGIRPIPIWALPARSG